MTNPSLGETLRNMASNHENRSESARLREVYADVEHALDSGVSRKAVLEVLHADGFTMSLKMFDKALYRIRSKARGTTAPVPVLHQAAEPAPVDETELKQPVPDGPKPITPSDLRKIRTEDIDTRRLSQPVKRPK